MRVKVLTFIVNEELENYFANQYRNINVQYVTKLRIEIHSGDNISESVFIFTPIDLFINKYHTIKYKTE